MADFYPEAPPLAETKIGEFVLECKIGQGGMGVVYRARQVMLDRSVALKFLSKHFRHSPEFVERFQREARAAALLVHPNIIQIYTVGKHQDVPYFAMEFIEGRDLTSLVRRTGQFTIGEAVEVLRAVARALTIAHEHKIVHRDIKPPNIMVSRSGLIKIMDFGLARAVTADSDLTKMGEILGTPTYVSPEQARGKQVDVRSDMYSLGCVFYECLTGKPPFQGEPLALVFKHTQELPLPPREKRADIPEAVEKICLRLLMKRPEDRFQTPRELLAAIGALNISPTIAEVALTKRVQESLAKEGPPILAESSAPNFPSANDSPGMMTIKQTPDQTIPVSPAVSPMKGTPIDAKSPNLRISVLRTEKADPPTRTVGAPMSGNAPSEPVLSYFQRAADNRWTFNKSSIYCAYAAPFNDGRKNDDALSGCTDCSNWTRSFGCAIAAVLDVGASSPLKGIDLIEQKISIWRGIGRFDKCIEIVEEYVRKYSTDPGGFWILARLFSRSSEKQDQRRARVLFARFIELAEKTGWRKDEIEMARRNLEALKTAVIDLPAQAGPSIVPPPKPPTRGAKLPATQIVGLDGEWPEGPTDAHEPVKSSFAKWALISAGTLLLVAATAFIAAKMGG